jgi:hypothetical protein
MNQLAAFERAFARDPVPYSLPGTHGVHQQLTGVLGNYGGASFRGGIYRIASEEMSRELGAVLTRMWPEYGGSMACFAFDWRGRFFAVRLEAKGKLGDVMLFEPGSGDSYEIPMDIERFHNEELVGFDEEALSAKLFREWSAAHRAGPAYSRCVGYKVPLFLGGQEDLTNLQESELEIYLELCAQLWAKSNDLPDGTVVKNVTIKEPEKIKK